PACSARSGTPASGPGRVLAIATPPYRPYPHQPESTVGPRTGRALDRGGFDDGRRVSQASRDRPRGTTSGTRRRPRRPRGLPHGDGSGRGGPPTTRRMGEAPIRDRLTASVDMRLDVQRLVVSDRQVFDQGFGAR